MIHTILYFKKKVQIESLSNLLQEKLNCLAKRIKKISSINGSNISEQTKENTFNNLYCSLITKFRSRKQSKRAESE